MTTDMLVLLGEMSYLYYTIYFTRLQTYTAGSSTMKVEPLPVPSDSARTVPPCAEIFKK